MKENEQYKRLIRLIMVVVLIAAEMTMYYWIWLEYYNELMQIPYDVKGNYAIAFVYGLIIFLLLRIYGGFRIGYLKAVNLIYSHILSIVCANVIIYIQEILIIKRMPSPAPLIFLTVLESVLVVIWSMASTRIYRKLYPSKRVVLIYGNRPVSMLKQKLHTREDRFQVCESIHISEGKENIQKKIKKYEGVVIGDIPANIRNQILKFCYGEGIRTYTMPKISDILIRSAESLHIFDTPLLLSRNIGLTAEQKVIKRMLDIVGSVCALFITSPVMILTMCAIKLYDRGPVFFTQDRCTQNGRIFKIYKFRSMIVDAEKDGKPIPATQKDPRITPIGSLIRATRIDELPQFFNILKGDMSLVGPRPERVEHVEKYTKEIPEFGYRMKVKGGLTGYAQVYGKYNTTAYDKLKLDLMYIENYSILLDIEIIFNTLKTLLMKESTEGFTEENSKAMSGNEDGEKS